MRTIMHRLLIALALYTVGCVGSNDNGIGTGEDGGVACESNCYVTYSVCVLVGCWDKCHDQSSLECRTCRWSCAIARSLCEGRCLD